MKVVAIKSVNLGVLSYSVVKGRYKIISINSGVIGINKFNSSGSPYCYSISDFNKHFKSGLPQGFKNYVKKESELC